MGNKFIKYLLVGVVNTVFGYSVFALLIYFNLHYLIASIFATIAGVLFNFKTIGRIVFKSNNNSLIIKFIAVYLITFTINLGGLKIFNSYHINMYLSGFLLIILCTPISFVLNNKFVFKKVKMVN